MIELSKKVWQFESYTKEDEEKIIEKAKSVGLDKIDPTAQYHLIKTGEKNKSPLGYPAKMEEALGGKAGRCFLTGSVSNDEVLVCLCLDLINNCFQTSSIVKCETHDGKMFIIETKNSFYELIEKN